METQRCTGPAGSVKMEIQSDLITLTEAQLFAVPETDLDLVMDIVEEVCFFDNGGDADGNAYFVEVSRFTPDQHRTLRERGYRVLTGTKLEGYEATEHRDLLDISFRWIGIAIEGYALIDASPQAVKVALNLKQERGAEAMQGLSEANEPKRAGDNAMISQPSDAKNANIT